MPTQTQRKRREQEQRAELEAARASRRAPRCSSCGKPLILNGTLQRPQRYAWDGKRFRFVDEPLFRTSSVYAVWCKDCATDKTYLLVDGKFIVEKRSWR